MEALLRDLRLYLRQQLMAPLGLLGGLSLLVLLALPILAHRYPVQGITWLVLAGLAVLVGLGRQTLSDWLWRLRPLARLRRVLTSCRFLTLLSANLRSQTNLLTALEKSARASANEECQQAVWAIVRRLERGQTLGQAFSQSDYFAREIREALMAGLQQNILDELLKAIQESPEVRLGVSACRLVELLTPMILLAWGALWVVLLDHLSHLL